MRSFFLSKEMPIILKSERNFFLKMPIINEAVYKKNLQKLKNLSEIG